MESSRIAITIFYIILLLKVIIAIRREHIRNEYSMVWLGSICLLLGVCLSEFMMNWIANLLEIHDSAVLLLLLAGLVFLFTFFSVTMQVSMLKDHNILVGQKLGILEWTVERQAAEIRRLEAELAASDRTDRSGGA